MDNVQSAARDADTMYEMVKWLQDWGEYVTVLPDGFDADDMLNLAEEWIEEHDTSDLEKNIRSGGLRSPLQELAKVAWASRVELETTRAAEAPQGPLEGSTPVLTFGLTVLHC